MKYIWNRVHEEWVIVQVEFRVLVLGRTQEVNSPHNPMAHCMCYAIFSWPRWKALKNSICPCREHKRNGVTIKDEIFGSFWLLLTENKKDLMICFSYSNVLEAKRQYHGTQTLRYVNVFYLGSVRDETFCNWDSPLKVNRESEDEWRRKWGHSPHLETIWGVVFSRWLRILQGKRGW